MTPDYIARLLEVEDSFTIDVYLKLIMEDIAAMTYNPSLSDMRTIADAYTRLKDD